MNDLRRKIGKVSYLYPISPKHCKSRGTQKAWKSEAIKTISASLSSILSVVSRTSLGPTRTISPVFIQLEL